MRDVIIIVHNGYKIKYVYSWEEVEAYIKEVLEPHLDLVPKKIMDKTLKNKNKRTRIIRYKYVTLYEEDFIIDYECGEA